MAHDHKVGRGEVAVGSLTADSIVCWRFDFLKLCISTFCVTLAKPKHGQTFVKFALPPIIIRIWFLPQSSNQQLSASKILNDLNTFWRRFWRYLQAYVGFDMVNHSKSVYFTTQSQHPGETFMLATILFLAPAVPHPVFYSRIATEVCYNRNTAGIEKLRAPVMLKLCQPSKCLSGFKYFPDEIPTKLNRYFFIVVP